MITLGISRYGNPLHELIELCREIEADVNARKAAICPTSTSLTDWPANGSGAKRTAPPGVRGASVGTVPER